MHAISSYRGNRPTNTQKHNKHTNTATNPQTGPTTIHCAANLSAQCKNLTRYRRLPEKYMYISLLALVIWVNVSQTCQPMNISELDSARTSTMTGAGSRPPVCRAITALVMYTFSELGLCRLLPPETAATTRNRYVAP